MSRRLPLPMPERLDRLIVAVRGLNCIIDARLAPLSAVRRNRGRIPVDVLIELAREEAKARPRRRSRACSRARRRSARREAMRAFVRLRRHLATYVALVRKLRRMCAAILR